MALGSLLLQVVCSTVRVWLVIVGLVCLVVGFLLGARVRLWPWRADWFEAAGTWVSAGLSAAILVWLAVRSEKQAKELEASRQARDDEEARQCEKVEASQVICKAWSTDSHEEDGELFAGAIVVAVNNHREGLVTNLKCQVHLDGGIGLAPLTDALTPGEGESQWTLPASEPIRHSKDDHEVHEGVVFRFLLNDAWWSRRPADTEAIREELTAAT
jgi:hypothetical protein